MAELRELFVKVPIKFSEKAQKDLYEICMAYKELAEMRDAENKKLRDYAYALEECNNQAHYCEFCPHWHYEDEYADPRCDFDFDALRAAAGMEVDE